MIDTNKAYPQTTILRNNPGMIRDCWVTDDFWLVIRQMKFNSDGSDADTKMIRLSPEEQEILFKVLTNQLRPL